jgi:hypothetical protein
MDDSGALYCTQGSDIGVDPRYCWTDAFYGLAFLFLSDWREMMNIRESNGITGDFRGMQRDEDQEVTYMRQVAIRQAQETMEHAVEVSDNPPFLA